MISGVNDFTVSVSTVPVAAAPPDGYITESASTLKLQDALSHVLSCNFVPNVFQTVNRAVS